MDPEKKSLNFIFPTKYVIPKSLKFSHWPSKYQWLVVTTTSLWMWRWWIARDTRSLRSDPSIQNLSVYPHSSPDTTKQKNTHGDRFLSPKDRVIPPSKLGFLWLINRGYHPETQQLAPEKWWDWLTASFLSWVPVLQLFQGGNNSLLNFGRVLGCPWYLVNGF